MQARNSLLPQKEDPIAVPVGIMQTIVATAKSKDKS